MSTLTSLRNKAARLAEQLRDAEAAAERATAERKARNGERVALFWSDAGKRCSDALAARSAARGAVVDYVAAGDLTDALAAYGDYVRRSVEAEAMAAHAKAATAVYVYNEGGVEVRTPVSEWAGAVPPAGEYRIEHAPGVPASSIPRLETFAALVDEGVERLTTEHRAAFTADLLAPLRAELEGGG